jgi:hypothetical protein
MWVYSGFVVGGEGGTFFSPGLTNKWSTTLSISNSIRVQGITQQNTYPYGYLLAGTDISNGQSYIINSVSGSSTMQMAPVTNTLFAIVNLAAPDNYQIPGPYVAVGANGTIITSGDGTNWVARNSGTTATLRTLVVHRGRLLAGGDQGVVLSSADGISWSAGAPASFDVRGMASDGNVVVAVGKYGNQGRLHVTTDGLSWVGDALEFTNTLNAVSYAASLYSFMAVGEGGTILQSSEIPHCPVNSWTNATSGYWEEPFWSCGHLPWVGDGEITVTNAGWKAVAIGQSTTAGFSSSLAVNTLTVGAPSNSLSTLLLNYAGTKAPLSARYLTLQTNASLLSYYSSLSAVNAFLYSPASFLENSVFRGNFVRAYSNLVLSNSVMSASMELAVRTNATVSQFGGTSDFYALVLASGGSFNLDGGSVHTHELCLNAAPDFYDGYLPTDGVCTFTQTNGNTSSDQILIGTHSYANQGRFVLQGGSLACSNYQFLSGTFSQSGGTNTVSTFRIPDSLPRSYGGAAASYELIGGTLISGTISLGVSRLAGEKDFTDNAFGDFTQSGGLHLNTGGIVIPGFISFVFGSYYQFPHSAGRYRMTDGILLCDSLSASYGGYQQSGGTNYTDLATLADASILGGALITSNTTIVGYVHNTLNPCAPPGDLVIQSNGLHYVQNTFRVGQMAGYNLEGGILKAARIEVDANGVFKCGDGAISNWESFALAGAFQAGTQSHYLGKLANLTSTYTQWCTSTNNSILDVSGPSGTFIRFRDSRDTDGVALLILNWEPWTDGGTSHHVFFGTNSAGLNQAELALVRFINPAGWPRGIYSTRILATGEVVPALPPSIIAKRTGDGMIVSWPGDYRLVTATNVLGPYSVVAGAISPFTNPFAGPERYFRLTLPP